MQRGESLQKRDPWQLLSCLPGSSKEDCFVMSTDPSGTTHPVDSQGLGLYIKHPVKDNLMYMPGGRRKKLNRVCPLFNKARVSSHHGEEYIYAHMCSVCKREDHGKCACPSRNQEGKKEGLMHNIK